MGHANIEKFNTKVLNFDGFGFLVKSKVTERTEEMLCLKPISRKSLDFRVKVLNLQEFRFLVNLIVTERIDLEST